MPKGVGRPATKDQKKRGAAIRSAERALGKANISPKAKLKGRVSEARNSLVADMDVQTKMREVNKRVDAITAAGIFLNVADRKKKKKK